MNQLLEGKNALITGIGRKGGIGMAIAERLASNGANVFFSYLHTGGEKLEQGEALEVLRAKGVRAETLEIDLSLPDAARRLFAAAVERLGYIDILVNNAACSENDGIDAISADEIDRHFSVNTRTPMLLVRELYGQAVLERGGRVVNITSGQAVGPMPDELAYISSKAALDGFTMSVAPALMHRGVTINSIDPGATDTGWITDELRERLVRESPLGRVMQPDDAARLVLFLASGEAGCITGQVIHSRGGAMG